MGDEQNEIEKKQEVLQRIIDCNLPLYSQLKTGSTPDFVQQSCLERDFCFAQETKQFCQQPFCSKDSTGDQVRLNSLNLQLRLSRVLLSKLILSQSISHQGSMDQNRRSMDPLYQLNGHTF